VYQAHKLHDNIHDLDLSTMDAKTVGEVRRFATISIVILGLYRVNARFTGCTAS